MSVHKSQMARLLANCRWQLAAMAAAFAVAAGAAPKPRVTSEAERRAAEAAREAAEGGRMEIGGKGRVAIVAAPGTATDVLKEEAARFGRTMHIHIDVVPGIFSLAGRGEALKAANANAVVFFADDSSLPASLVALEERWAFVNVACLRSGAPDAATFGLRARKMLVRALFGVLGAACSKYPANPLKPIATASDLDALPEPLLTIDSAMGMYGYLPGIGLERYEVMTYRDACEEGVAPPPTNDVQKAIWEKVKSDKERGPTNPITIPPPKK